MAIQNELKPKAVFDYFAQINKVPRPSKHEEKMIEFLKNFAKKHNLPCKVDKAGNVLISKPASKGMEDRATIVLQSHMDMVCEKTSDCKIDFTKDPITTYVDGEWMRAKGTTLGADDGIGDAMQMAVLTDETLKHGPIECVFTRDEETGLTGAFEMKSDFMTGKYLLNLDSEDEGEIFIGCAGGINTEITFSYKPVAVPRGFISLKVSVDKLTGGHSGDDINKNRANANKVLARFLYQAEKAGKLRLVSFNGGNLHNAIPRNAEAVIMVPEADKHKIRKHFNVFISQIEEEYHKTEPNVAFKMQSVDKPKSVMDKETSSKIICALQAVHNGVLEYSQDIPGLVETSSNLASVKMLGDNKVHIVTSQRSSILSQRDAMRDTIIATFTAAGAKCKATDGYPGWTPNPDSTILKIAVDAYKKLFKKDPAVKAIHAGLECGLFAEKYPGMDMISFGPTLRGVHSPDECLLIPTVQMVWDHLVEILENAPKN
ncbi:MAG: aminoacyl-histidine dipeptidase [Prevotellaceae bacterium]|nr:aminoacyl-histidine dipeptidase [Candidatus Colivivens equi]